MTDFAKIVITATMILKTGTHIGAGGAFSAIGAVDSTVVRDPLTRLPLIPGSSVKGKMRSLLAREFNPEYMKLNPEYAPGQVARTANEDCPRIARLFGTSDPVTPARLLFRDSVLTNAEELKRRGVKQITEIKFENTINRLTAQANPRQIERAITGSEFAFELVYEVPTSVNEQSHDSEKVRQEVEEDFETVVEGLRLLTYDYIGGHGSRGYGRVAFTEATAEVVVGALDSKLLAELNTSLSKICEPTDAEAR